VGLALLSLALVAPATATARPKAAAAEPAKVLVVTSTQDALSAAGIASIQAGAASGNFAGLSEWLVNALGGAVVGLVIGGIIAVVVRQLTKHPEEFVVE